MTGMFGPILGGKAHGTYLEIILLTKTLNGTSRTRMRSQVLREKRRQHTDSVLPSGAELCSQSYLCLKDTDEHHPFGKWKAQQVYLKREIHSMLMFPREGG